MKSVDSLCDDLEVAAQLLLSVEYLLAQAANAHDQRQNFFLDQPSEISSSRISGNEHLPLSVSTIRFVVCHAFQRIGPAAEQTDGVSCRP
jgi:hypothetical protein